MKRKKRLPKNIRKYIRYEKTRIRRQVLDLAEQRKQIEEIYKKFGIKRKELVLLPPLPVEKVELAKKLAKKKIK